MEKLLVIQQEPFIIPDKLLKRIEKVVNNYDLEIKKAEAITDGDIEKAEIIYGYFAPQKLKKAKNLKWLHLPMAGVERFVDKDLYYNKDIVLTNSSGVFGKPMAEHAIALILAFNRNIHKYVKDQEKRKWDRYAIQKDFFDSTVGILGLGDIGKEVAKRSKALGAKVIATKRNINEKYDYIDKLYKVDELDSLLREADTLVLSLPDTKKTRNIIAKKQFDMMKENTYIVNLGRGSAINTDDLIDALKKGKIAGAGLDVTDPEPLDKENKLWGMENVIITSHTSGLSPSTMDRNVQIFIDNYLSYINNHKMITQIDFSAGY